MGVRTGVGQDGAQGRERGVTPRGGGPDTVLAGKEKEARDRRRQGGPLCWRAPLSHTQC